jgi:hypothetical protein
MYTSCWRARHNQQLSSRTELSNNQLTIVVHQHGFDVLLVCRVLLQAHDEGLCLHAPYQHGVRFWRVNFVSGRVVVRMVRCNDDDTGGTAQCKLDLAEIAASPALATAKLQPLTGQGQRDILQLC